MSEDQSAHSCEEEEPRVHTTRPEAVEQHAYRDLNKSDPQKKHTGKQSKVSRAEPILGSDLRPKQRVCGAKRVRHIVARHEWQKDTQQQVRDCVQLFGFSIPPR